MVNNIIAILLLLGQRFLKWKFFLEACVMEPVFWLMQFGCTKRNTKKLANAG